MPILQLHLQPGRQRVKIPNHIPKSNFKLVGFATHFNRKNHGFYMVKIGIDKLPSNAVNNNLGFYQTLVMSVDHEKSYENREYDLDLGSFELYENFEINVDLDSGHQIVQESATRVGQPYSFRPFNNPSVEVDYVVNPPASRRVSLGVQADDILNNVVITDVNGVLEGPLPFLYSLVMTLEYENNLF